MRTFLSISLLVLAAGAKAQTAGVPSNLPPGLYAIIHTSMGDITAELFEHQTPNTVRNFIGLARGTRPWLDPKTHKGTTRPLYEDITFHRVIPNFMIQTGDPTGTGAHNCGFVLQDEIVRGLKFDRPGRLAMANIGKPNTGACQFFITEKPFPDGNGQYTIFGQVVSGMELVGQIARVKRDGNDKPKTPVGLSRIDIIRVVLKPSLSRGRTGSGILINASGDILTSADVVQDCTEIHLQSGQKLASAVVDRQNGLAALHSGNKADSFAVFRGGDEVAAQDSVWTIAPGPAVVNATADSHGDNRFFQLNVAVAPETAGGPVLDSGGNVAGILASGADTPANSGVAVKATVATGFLDASGIKYTAQSSTAPADHAAALDSARRYTVALECWK